METADGKLHFAIPPGNVLIKPGNPAGHFTLAPLREAEGEWRVVAESKP